MEVVAAQPNPGGWGVRAGNTTDLASAVACSNCGLPGNRNRKFLYLSTAWAASLADVASSDFLAKKLELETELDNIFYLGQFGAGAGLDYKAGYCGSTVLSLWETQAGQLGAGRRRRKRSFQAGGTGVEVEISFRAPSVAASDIEAAFDAGSVTDLVGDTALAPAVCEESELSFDHGKLEVIQQKNS